MILLTEGPLNTAEVMAAVADPSVGATVVFVGTVRSSTAGQAVECLEYEAYRVMAEKKMAEIASVAQARWGARVAIAHRIGRVKVGEVSVVIAVATPHRAEAFEACRYLIDALKEEVPIWKKEHRLDGSVWV